MKSSVRNIFSKKAETTHNASVLLHRLVQQNEIQASIATFNFAWLNSGETIAEHAHSDCIEYFLVLTGKGVVFLNGKQTPVIKGSLVTIAPDTLHSMSNENSDVLEFITLRAIIKTGTKPRTRKT